MVKFIKLNEIHLWTFVNIHDDQVLFAILVKLSRWWVNTFTKRFAGRNGMLWNNGRSGTFRNKHRTTEQLRVFMTLCQLLQIENQIQIHVRFWKLDLEIVIWKRWLTKSYTNAFIIKTPKRHIHAFSGWKKQKCKCLDKIAILDQV